MVEVTESESAGNGSVSSGSSVDTVMEKNLNEYKFLHVTQDDMNQASYFAAHLLKKGWHFRLWDKGRRWKTYMHQAAYTTALAMAYARPFAEAGAKHALKYAQLKRKFDAQQQKLHDDVIERRNKVYAHSDLNIRDVRPEEIDGHASAVERTLDLRFEHEELVRLQSMISIALGFIAERKRELLPSIREGNLLTGGNRS